MNEKRTLQIKKKRSGEREVFLKRKLFLKKSRKNREKRNEFMMK